jgi:8-hydroxy-5-deazaflavin:NADPH oxidoreductase
MRIGVLGTGMAGREIGDALIRAGHEVCMGSRTAGNEKAAAWSAAAGANASHGTFAHAAAFAEVVFNCTAGAASLEALYAAGAENLAGKIVIDVANPLDFSRGMPPSLTVCNTDSLGEQIQRGFPRARVVKALNTMNCQIMVNPALVPGAHNVFVCGNDAEARQAVAHWLGEWFGWRGDAVIDLGDMSAARGLEMVLPLWVRLMTTLGTAGFNFSLARPVAVPAGS